MLKTKQTRKAAKKLKKLQKSGKLPKHTVDRFKGIKARKSAGSRKRALDIEDDWLSDRRAHFANEDHDDVLPLDMLDADLDWNSYSASLAAKRKRMGYEDSDDEEEEQPMKEEIDDSLLEETKPRFFPGQSADVRELLPIKVDGKIVRKHRLAKDEEKFDEDDFDKDADMPNDDDGLKSTVDDLSNLSAVELVAKRMQLLDEARNAIAHAAQCLAVEPQGQMSKLKELYLMAIGDGLSPVVRETVQKLAVASLVSVFIDLIPGYAIRAPTEAETGPKLKKETKRLHDFEAGLLRWYQRFLQFLARNAQKVAKSESAAPSGFSHQLSLLSMKCLSRLLLAVPHFNFAGNIIDLLVKLSQSTVETTRDECCTTLSDLFKQDRIFRVSLHGARAISQLVQQKSSMVPPELLRTFLNLNIKEIGRQEDDKKGEKKAIMKKKYRLKAERRSKKERKYDKQLGKLENDLKEAEAAESISTKMQLATETMKHVFAAYFRVLRRVSNSTLLAPVLEGLSKFAHLINVEFFDDLISSMQQLVEQQHLRTLDQLNCIHTVFVILSGDGRALNIDPCNFYRAIYRILPRIAVERDPGVQRELLGSALRCLDLMLTGRRKQVGDARVAAFIKRLVLLAFVVPSSVTTAMLAASRKYFITFPGLTSSLMDEEGSVCGVYNGNSDDPDHCNAMSSTIIGELDRLLQHPNPVVVAFARNLRHQLPTTGQHRLPPELNSRKPSLWLDHERSHDDEPSPFLSEILAVKGREKKASGKMQNRSLNAGDVCSRVIAWLESPSNGITG